MVASIAPSRYRWAILALGAGSTAALAAAQSGLPALGPALHTAFGLSLVEVTGVFTAFGVFRLMTAMSSLNPRATPAPLAIVFVLIAGMCAVAGAFATRKLRQARPAEIF